FSRVYPLVDRTPSLRARACPDVPHHQERHGPLPRKWNLFCPDRILIRRETPGPLPQQHFVLPVAQPCRFHPSVPAPVSLRAAPVRNGRILFGLRLAPIVL